LLTCETGLLFDKKTNKCVSPELSDCTCSNKDKIPAADACNTYWYCRNGTLEYLWCPKIPIIQVFDPKIKQCIPNVKLPVDNHFECAKSFKECLNVYNKYETWTIFKCDPFSYFDHGKQECLPNSDCNN